MAIALSRLPQCKVSGTRTYVTHHTNKLVYDNIRYNRWSNLRAEMTTISRHTCRANKFEDQLRDVSPDHREDVSRLLELAERSLNTWEMKHSCFYSPPIVYDGLMVLQRLADVKAMASGGYPQAERCRISVGREEMMSNDIFDDSKTESDAIAAVMVKGNFLFDPASHRDFLGACLGTGIDRSVIGDILVQGDNGAQIICLPSIVEHLEATLIQVRTVPVKTARIPLSDLRVPEARVREMQSVEASKRLDAIASAGFRMSRSKMNELIKSGDVRLNWRQCCKPSTEVNEGDMIAVHGKGRLELGAFQETKKGKFVIEMKRFV